MAILSNLTIIGTIAFSLAMGFLTFYLFSNITKEQTKNHINELISQFINFVIFIWLSKIILNLSIFITDPLSILAYPSDSKAFYFAIVLQALFLLYKSKRKDMDVLPLMESFVFVFLISSFIYEFISFIVGDNTPAISYIILLSILIWIFFFIGERVNATTLLIVLITIWSFGMVILAFAQPFVTVFSYIMAPWFIGVIFVTSIFILTNKLRKRDR